MRGHNGGLSIEISDILGKIKPGVSQNSQNTESRNLVSKYQEQIYSSITAYLTYVTKEQKHFQVC